MDNKAYRVASDDEKRKADVCGDYDLLIGPDGFECVLGEPEDRQWSRDADLVVKELNRLYELTARTYQGMSPPPGNPPG